MLFRSDHVRIRARRTDRHAQLRTKEPIREENRKHDNDRTDEQDVRRRIQSPDIPLGKECLLLQERQICLAHDAQIDGVQSDRSMGMQNETLQNITVESVFNYNASQLPSKLVAIVADNAEVEAVSEGTLSYLCRDSILR